MAAVESPTYDREKVNVAVYRVEVWKAILEYLELQKPPAVVRRNAACSGQGVGAFFAELGQTGAAARPNRPARRLSAIVGRSPEPALVCRTVRSLGRHPV